MGSITVSDVNRFCSSRPVDIVVCCGTHECPLALHGEFDGYGDFFVLKFGDIEYIDIADGFPVGGMALSTVSDVSSKWKKWSALSGEYSAAALVLWSADASSLLESEDRHLFLIVAGIIECVAGSDWKQR